MKRFEFRLEKVLRLRKIREDSRKRELGGEVRTLVGKQQELSMAQKQDALLRERFFRVDRSGKVDVPLLRRFQSFHNVLSWIVKDGHLKVGEQQGKVDAARTRLQEARCKTQVLEKMRDMRSFQHRQETRRDEAKLMAEHAGTSHARSRKGEEGGVIQYFLAVTSAGFLTILLFTLVLLAMGYLSKTKLILIAQVMGYDRGAYPKQLAPQLNLVAGEDEPRVVYSSTLRALRAIHEQYNRMLADDTDDENILTREVLNARKGILDNVLETIYRDKTVLDDGGEALKKKEEDLARRETELKKGWEEFNKAVAGRKAEQMDAAMEENNATYKSMDPDQLAKVLTKDQLYEELEKDGKGQKEIRELTAYAARYLSKLPVRQRTAVMEALGPKWSRSVADHLENPQTGQ